MSDESRSKWVLAVNDASGPGDRAKVDALTAVIPASVEWRVAERAERQPFDEFVEAVCRQCSESGARLMVLGGDGTASAFASASLRADIAVGLLPGGTFNYAARGLGIDTDPQRAIKQLLDGDEKKVTLPEVNGRLFLVNLSLGVHRDMIDTREELADQIGRSRLTAVMGSLLTLLRAPRRLSLAVEIDQRSALKLRASGLYITSNPLLQQRVSQVSSSQSDLKSLTLATLRQPGLWSILKGMLASATGARLPVAEVSHLGAEQRIILSRRRRASRPLSAVLDGERVELQAPLRVSMSREVRFIVPAERLPSVD